MRPWRDCPYCGRRCRGRTCRDCADLAKLDLAYYAPPMPANRAEAALSRKAGGA
jgi:hypothetical protein